MNRTRFVLGALALVSIAAPSTPAIAGSSVPPSGGSDFAELLAMVPAESVAADSGLVYYTDMALLWERVGVGSGEQERLDAMGELGGPDTYSITPQVFGTRFALIDEARAEVGFSFADIERELAVIAPPRSIFIDVTSVPADAIHAAIDSDPVWADRVTRVDSGHGEYVDWGDGGDIDPSAISPLRPLGQAGQLAVLGDPATTVRTLDAADVESVLATTAGAGESAADSLVLGPISDALTDETVMQAIVQPSPPLFDPAAVLLGSQLDPAQLEQFEQLLENTVLMQPYLGLAIIEIADGGSTRTEVLLVHVDEASAAANASLAEAMLGEGVDLVSGIPLAETFPNASVAVDGRVLRIDVSSDAAFRQAVNMLTSRALFPIG